MADERLTTQNLMEILINKHGFKKEDAETFLKEFFLLIEEGLEKDSLVKVKGLGTFKLIEVKSRESINVNTGERFEIQGHTKVSFTPEASLRDSVNKPFAHFETIILNDGVTFSDEEIVDADQDLNDENDVEDIPDSADVIVSDTPENLEIIIPAPVQEPVDTTVIIPPAVPTDADETPNEDLETPDVDVVDDSVTEEVIPESAPIKAVKPNDSHMKAVLAAVLLTLIICGAAIIFIFFPDIFSNNNKSEKEPVSHIETENAHPIGKQDTIASTVVATPDTIAKVIEQKPAVIPAATLTPAKKTPAKTLTTEQINALPVNPDSTSYTIAGTRSSHTIKAGETLTRISYQYYGTKDLWPYLVKHNRKKIPNPNSVPVGTTIQIPELKKK